MNDNKLKRRDVLKQGAIGAGALVMGGVATSGSAAAQDCVRGFWVGAIPDQTFSLSSTGQTALFQPCKSQGNPQRRGNPQPPGIVHQEYRAVSCDNKGIGTFWTRVVTAVPSEAQVNTVNHDDCVSGPEGAKEITLCPASCPPAEQPEGEPDLIPVPDETDNFCRRSNGDLEVVVQNVGTAPAGTSTTEVAFEVFDAEQDEFVTESVSQPTPGLDPDESATLTFEIPLGCFAPNCNFTITVDANDDVDESNEGNNQVESSCIG